MLFSSTKGNRGVRKTRAKRGAVAIMAVLIVIVMAMLFQAYMTHVLSDMRTGQTFDEVSQYNGERMAIGNLVKEAVLQFYERPRVGQAVPATLQKMIEEYLGQINATGVMYSVKSIDPFPTNGLTVFWPIIPDSAAAGVNTAIGTFNLYSEKVPIGMLKGRVAEYAGDSAASILAVRKSGDSDIFQVIVTRYENGSNVDFTYYLRMFQVPVTNFNLISYAITDKGADIPATPPALGAKIDLSTISSLVLSKMGLNGSANSINQTISYPYMYRELFSSAASVWEYALYNNKNASNVNYMVTEVMKDADDIYMLSDPYYGDVTKTTTTAGVTTTDICSYFDGRNGFYKQYFYNGTSVDAEGYHVTATGGDTDNTGRIIGLLNRNDNSLVVDNNLDGIINHQDVIGGALGAPDEIDWVFDLNQIPDTAGNFRKLYIHLPDSLPSAIKDFKITITDSSHGTAATPVIICIEGWSRANNKIEGNPYPVNYKIYLDGDLTDQQVMLYVVGADVLLESDCKMDGLMFFDDKLAGFSRNLHTFTFRGLFAWNGTMTAPNLSPSAIGIDDDYITVNPLPAGTDNQFRSIAPRFLLVDVKSETKIP